MELTAEQKLYQDVIQKAWEDETFKEELKKNPVETIEKLTGVQLNIPADKKIIVRDQTDESTVYINIPVEKKMEDVILNEDQLDKVAGGIGNPIDIKEIILGGSTGPFDPSPE